MQTILLRNDDFKSQLLPDFQAKARRRKTIMSEIFNMECIKNKTISQLDTSHEINI